MAEELSPEEYQTLLDIYGPAARFSEDVCGQIITYQVDGFTYRGKILWVCAAGDVAGVMLPLRYVVAQEADTSIIDIVCPGACDVGA